MRPANGDAQIPPWVAPIKPFQEHAAPAHSRDGGASALALVLTYSRRQWALLATVKLQTEETRTSPMPGEAVLDKRAATASWLSPHGQHTWRRPVGDFGDRECRNYGIAKFKTGAWRFASFRFGHVAVPRR